jgi:NAD(P)-dependent dehydrogenase (short-subunit alcohol dehydrogenase family)
VQGKVVVITGGFGVLGRAAGKVAHEAGAKVVLVDYMPAPSTPLSEDVVTIGGVDLISAEAALAALRTPHQTHDLIDALLNIAGGFTWSRVAYAAIDQWEKMFAINTKTAVNASKAALPYLIETEGAIVNVGANGALKAGAGFGPYAASKQGVHKLTEALAEELKGKVRVNAVLPSVLDTKANRDDMPNADFSTWVQPEELARVMLFLASPQAREITGALIPVTGRV